jgi:hypothetical protein
MILAEKKALTEKKNYQNMAIRLRKNFKRFYYRRRFLRQKIKNFRNFLKKYKAGFYKRKIKKKKLKIRSARRRSRRRILNFKSYRRLLRKIYSRAYKKRFFFSYLKLRVESFRLKNYLSKFK